MTAQQRLALALGSAIIEHMIALEENEKLKARIVELEAQLPAKETP